MSYILSKLEPQRLWELFEELSKYPRPSKHEEKITEFIVDFAKKLNLNVLQDSVGNILIKKPAYPGMEHLKTVVLQSHIDMVCEKNADSKHDFFNDPIIPFIDNDWVKARGTTLGADDGIGVASQLAILESNQIQHGPLECLFTIDEESGMTGAFGLDPHFMDSKILLNLDSEDEGELFIGCAGGKDTVARFNLLWDDVKSPLDAFLINVGGLKGGHSGDDINKELGNSVKVLTRLLWTMAKTYSFKLAHIDAGNLRNAIAREAEALVLLPHNQSTAFVDDFYNLAAIIKLELNFTEPNLAIKIDRTNCPAKCINDQLSERLIHALFTCPHGVIHMTPDIPGLVETSTNLASVKIKDNAIVVATSQRSSVQSRRDFISDAVAAIFKNAGAHVEHSDGYPGWKPNMNSEILQITTTAYKKLFNVEPKVLAIHAGLECGLIAEKYPKMDMISFGPTIKGAHSPDERINIPSAIKYWKLLLEILINIPSN